MPETMLTTPGLPRTSAALAPTTHTRTEGKRFNVFICFAQEDGTFARDLDDALRSRRRLSAIDWEKPNALIGASPAVLKRIEDAGTFVFIISPSSVASDVCRRQLDHAQKHRKVIVPIVRVPVAEGELPPSVVSLPAIDYSAEVEWEKAFEKVIKAVNTNLRVDVFICYARADKQFINRLYEELTRTGRRVWLDLSSIPTSTVWHQEIHSGIEAADNFLFIISPDSVRPDSFCHKELAHAHQNNKRVIPLYHREVPPEMIPSMLAQYQRRDFPLNGDFEADFQRLLADLDEDPGYLREHTRLLTRAVEWQRSEKDKSLLLRGGDLTRAEELVRNSAEKRPHFTNLQTQYVIASRQGANRSRNKVLTWVTAALVLTLVLSVGLFFQTRAANASRNTAEARQGEAEAANKDAQRQKDEAKLQQSIAEEQKRIADEQKGIAEVNQKKAEDAAVAERKARDQAEERRLEAERQTKLAFARELAATATVQSSLDPPLGLHLSVKAIETTPVPTKEAEDALRVSMASLSNLHTVLKSKNADTFNPGLVAMAPGLWWTEVSFSPDGELVLLTGGGAVMIYEVKSSTKVGEIKSPKDGKEIAVITVAKFSPDGTRILTKGEEKAVRLWTRTGQPVARLPTISDQPNILAFSPDSKFVVTGGAEGTSREEIDNRPDDRRMPQVWESATGRHVISLEGHSEQVEDIEFSADGKYLAAMNGYRGAALVWRTDSWQRETRLDDLEGNDLLDFSPDGKLVLVLKGDNLPVVYETKNWRSVGTLKGHEGVVTDSMFSPDGKFVLTWGGTEEARLWETGGWKEIAKLKDVKRQQQPPSFSPDSRFIVSAGKFADLGVWEVGSGRLVTRLDAHSPFQFSPDGRTLATRGDRSVRLWTTGDWRNIASLRGQQLPAIQLNFSPEGNYLVTTSVDGLAQVWNTMASNSVVELRGYSDRMLRAEFSPDGKLLLAEGYYDYNQEAAIYVWDALTNQSLHIFQSRHPAGHVASFRALSFGSDSRRVYALDSRNTFHIWDAYTGEEKYVKDDFVPDGSSSHFSLGGKYIVIARAGELSVQVRDITTGQIIDLPLTEKAKSTPGVMFSPDGQRLLIFSNGEAKVWDLGMRKVLCTLPGLKLGPKVILEFSPNGELIGRLGEQVLRVWDGNTGEKLQTLALSTEYQKSKGRSKDKLTRHRSPGDTEIGENGFAFSPDGSNIVLAGGDNNSRVWDWRAGRQVAVLPGHSAEVLDARFSIDGKRIVTAGRDGAVRVYPWEMYAPLEELLRLAPTRVTRSLTPAESVQYLHVRPKEPRPLSNPWFEGSDRN